MTTTDRAEFLEQLAAHIGAPPLRPAEIESALALASVAAHGTGDRTAAPLATFLAGVAAAGQPDRLEVIDRMRQYAGQAPHGE